MGLCSLCLFLVVRFVGSSGQVGNFRRVGNFRGMPVDKDATDPLCANLSPPYFP
jgi:hypothetical protein